MRTLLDFYYDYSIRSTSVNDEATEPNKTKSVIGFIDTTQDGTGATKARSWCINPILSVDLR